MRLRFWVVAAACLACSGAWADGVDVLREFVREVKTGQANFTQTVTGPPGQVGTKAKQKTSSGTFEFARPNRFRFAYSQPFEQLIVADGHKVWMFDADLNQVTARKISQALGATPAALLAGGDVEQDFTLKPLPDTREGQIGLSWVEAVPKNAEGSFQSLRIAFKGRELWVLEILDNLGQRSVLQFSQVVSNPSLAPERFSFKVPAGADVIEP
jgi:outer membrane lipoprotein carrier protein